jgi:hypothetical protein
MVAFVFTESISLVDREQRDLPYKDPPAWSLVKDIVGNLSRAVSPARPNDRRDNTQRPVRWLQRQRSLHLGCLAWTALSRCSENELGDGSLRARRPPCARSLYATHVWLANSNIQNASNPRGTSLRVGCHTRPTWYRVGRVEVRRQPARVKAHLTMSAICNCQRRSRRQRRVARGDARSIDDNRGVAHVSRGQTSRDRTSRDRMPARARDEDNCGRYAERTTNQSVHLPLLHPPQLNMFGLHHFPGSDRCAEIRASGPPHAPGHSADRRGCRSPGARRPCAHMSRLLPASVSGCFECGHRTSCPSMYSDPGGPSYTKLYRVCLLKDRHPQHDNPPRLAATS